MNTMNTLLLYGTLITLSSGPLIAAQSTTVPAASITTSTVVRSDGTESERIPLMDLPAALLGDFGHPHVRLGGAIGCSAGVTLCLLNGHNFKSGVSADFGRGGMKLTWGEYFSPMGSPWPKMVDWKPVGGLRLAFVRGWNDRDESDLPSHIVGKVQDRWYLGPEAVLSLGRIGPAIDIGAYRAIGDPHEYIVAIGYGLGL